VVFATSSLLGKKTVRRNQISGRTSRPIRGKFEFVPPLDGGGKEIK
jgi:hypothetical protein